MKPAALRDSLDRAVAAIDMIENNRKYTNQKPMCEPKLGDYGLYSTIGGRSAGEYQLALLWILNMSDGATSLLDIAERSSLPWGTLRRRLLHCSPPAWCAEGAASAAHKRVSAAYAGSERWRVRRS